MTSITPVLLIVGFTIMFQSHVNCNTSDSGKDMDKSEESSIAELPSGKRQHNIMRFGKRPAGGHNLIHFGKRPDSSPQHTFLSFGKKSSGLNTYPEILQYLSRNGDNSYKRGHTIMRFGKRGGEESHNFMRFGKRDDIYDDYDEYDDSEIDDQKRNGHSMMSFGKRGNGHSMMSFGKRSDGHNMLSFGKRGDGHTMLSFGKRGDGHTMLSFGKRGGHAILSFGKRGEGKPSAHSMIHFGKRDDDSDDYIFDEKRAHSMIHFGKRDSDLDLDEKRAPHSMIHFGKRMSEMDDVTPYFWNVEPSEKREPNLAKNTEAPQKGSSHAIIHFGKRSSDKKAHAMIHFGKRSVAQVADQVTSNNSEQTDPKEDVALNRMKRDADLDPLLTLVRYNSEDEDQIHLPEESFMAPNRYFNVITPLEDTESDDNIISPYVEYSEPVKKDDSKNMFLRFG